MCIAKEQLRNQLAVYMAHPFAEKCVQLIQVDEIYLEFICQVLQQKKIPQGIGLKYGCAILLAHLALCIHDELDRRKLSPSEKQLMILLGAYYTSLYYELLCEVNDEAFIYRIAEGIANQSEARMQLVQKSFADAADFLRQKAETDWMIFSEALKEFQLNATDYLHYKYQFLRQTVRREFRALQSDALLRPFYPKEWDTADRSGLEQMMLTEIEKLLKK